MKRWMIFGSCAMAAVLAIGFATTLRAQPGIAGGMNGGMNGGMAGGQRRQAPPPMPPTIKTTEHGIFVIQGNVVLKYDPATLKLEQQLDVTDKLTATAQQQTAQARPMRPQPSGVLMTDDSMLLVAGNHFFRIDTATLQVQADVTLPATGTAAQPHDMATPDRAQGGAPEGENVQGPQGMGPNDGGPQDGMPQGPPPGMQGPPRAPVMELQGKTLYILRGSNLTAIDITAGKTLAQAALPRPEVPKAANNNIEAPQ